MSAKWVQHKSGQGEKWEVDSFYDDHEMFWRVPMKPGVADLVYRLPKSEYIECDPPERWEECTREAVHVESDGSFTLKEGWSFMRQTPSKLRWAWHGDALVIERRTS